MSRLSVLKTALENLFNGSPATRVLGADGIADAVNVFTGSSWWMADMQTAAGSVSALTHSGLHGDLDLEYMILLHIDGNAHTSAIYYGLTFNADGGVHYGYQPFLFSGAASGTAGSAKGSIHITTNITTTAQFYDAVIFIPAPASGKQRQIIANGSLVVTASAAAPTIINCAGHWNQTDEITSIAVTSYQLSDDAVKSGIPSGSTSKLFVRRA